MTSTKSPRVKQIALENTILRIHAGSGLFGTALPGQHDRDELGVCIEPPDYVIGLETFEQYSDHLDDKGNSKPKDERSGPGDLDITINSLRRWARMAAGGDATSLMLLYAPQSHWVAHHPVAFDLQAHSHLFISQQCTSKFLGYLYSQARQLKQGRNTHTNRPELVDEFGFDTKAAYHAVRVGIQGAELLRTGRITLPMPEAERAWLTDLRVAKNSKDEAIQRILASIAEIKRVAANSLIPDQPDKIKLNEWIIDTYLRWWDLSY